MKTARPAIDRMTYVMLGNWRNFTSVSVPLQQRMFVVGPNASGKSNFLDVFRFLHDVASVGGGFQSAVERRGGVGQIKCMSAHRRLDVTVDIGLGNDVDPNLWRYTLRFNDDENDNRRLPIIAQEQVQHRDRQLLNRPTREDLDDPVRLTQTHLEQVVTNSEFRDIADYFRSIRYLHVVPQQVRDAKSPANGYGDPYGSDLLQDIDRLPARLRKSRLASIERTLKQLVPQIQRLEFWKDGYGRSHLRLRHHFWPSDEWQTEDHFSDGTLRLFGILWALEARGGVSLFEEPELSLHPDIIRLLPQIFGQIQARADAGQIMISTHSPDLLRGPGIALDEILLLQPNHSGETGTTVRSASDYEQIKVLLDAGLPLDEAVLPETRATTIGTPVLARTGSRATETGGW